VRRTGQIGMILVRGYSKIRQDWRVEFLCGGRAESAGRQDAALIAQLAATIKCAPAELSASVDRLLREREAATRRVKSLLPKVAVADAAALLAAPRAAAAPNPLRVVTQVSEGAESEYLQLLATALVRAEM